MDTIRDLERPVQRPALSRHVVPAVMMRAGTSKGIFIHRRDLPRSQTEWTRPLLAIMGSQGNDGRQIDGVGGATSTTSKVAVVSQSTRLNIDVDYTFAQVAVGNETVDYSGNCGNIASGVGPFALQEGLVQVLPGSLTKEVRMFNTNTCQVLVSTLQLHPDGSFKEEGSCFIPGVKLPSSEVKVAFIDPAGSMTGKLFPTGQRTQALPVPQRHSPFFSVRATLIDAANPFILVDKSSLPHHLRACQVDTPSYLDQMEAIRRAGAVAMGLAKSCEEAAKTRGTPKLAIIEPARDESAKSKRLRVQAFSMGKAHPSLQLTGAVCIASATCIRGTVAHQAASAIDISPQEGLMPTPERTPSPDGTRDTEELLDLHQEVCIEHSAGKIDVEVNLDPSSKHGDVMVSSCSVSRTARRLFEGNVYYYQ